MREAANILVQLFHPMMPHLAEECWAALGHDTLVAQAPWPQVERDLLIEDTVTLPVQINGKKRADVTVRAQSRATPKSRAAVLALDAVKRALDGKPPKKVIIVPQRIVNVVAWFAHGRDQTCGCRCLRRAPRSGAAGRARLRSGRRPGQRARQRLIKASVDDPNDPFALARLEGEELSAEPSRLVEEAQTIPLFGGRRAVWVKAGRPQHRAGGRGAAGSTRRANAAW